MIVGFEQDLCYDPEELLTSACLTYTAMNREMNFNLKPCASLMVVVMHRHG